MKNEDRIMTIHLCESGMACRGKCTIVCTGKPSYALLGYDIRHSKKNVEQAVRLVENRTACHLCMLVCALSEE